MPGELSGTVKNDGAGNVSNDHSPLVNEDDVTQSADDVQELMPKDKNLLLTQDGTNY